jgi:hypothetical protein
VLRAPELPSQHGPGDKAAALLRRAGSGCLPRTMTPVVEAPGFRELRGARERAVGQPADRELLDAVLDLPSQVRPVPQGRRVAEDLRELLVKLAGGERVKVGGAAVLRRPFSRGLPHYP